MERKDEYRHKLESQLEEWKTLIDQMEERAKKGTAHMKIDLLEAIETLQLKKDAVQARLDELRHAGDEVWGNLKKKSETAVLEMKTTLEQALSKFKH